MYVLVLCTVAGHKIFGARVLLLLIKTKLSRSNIKKLKIDHLGQTDRQNK